MKSEQNILKTKVAGSLAWKFFERGSVQIAQFIVSLIVARILNPQAYGLVALLSIFITFATVFVQSGLSTALVQKKETDAVEYSSVFYYNLALAIIVYFILFFLAEPIATFYEQPSLKYILRVMALTLFPGALNALQIAILSKQFEYKKQFYSSLIAVVLSGILGIGLALFNLGVWALVVQQLSYQILICIVLWFLVKWRPTLQFSFTKTKSLLKYGVKLLAANLIDTIYHNLESLIIGKKYSKETLAFYVKGKQFPLILVDNIDGSIQSVMLSAFSKKQEHHSIVKSMLRRTVSVSTYLVFPAMTGLALIGSPLILLLLGPKWADCVPFLQLYCIISMLFPLQTANLQAFNAIGRSDVYLKLMIIKRLFGLIALALSVAMFDNAYFIVLACLATEIVSILINIIPNTKILNYHFSEQVKDLCMNMILSIAMGIVVYSINYLPLGYIITLILQIVCGGATYVILSKITKNESFNYILRIIKER